VPASCLQLTVAQLPPAPSALILPAASWRAPKDEVLIRRTTASTSAAPSTRDAPDASTPGSNRVEELGAAGKGGEEDRVEIGEKEQEEEEGGGEGGEGVESIVAGEAVEEEQVAVVGGVEKREASAQGVRHGRLDTGGPSRDDHSASSPSASLPPAGAPSVAAAPGGKRGAHKRDAGTVRGEGRYQEGEEMPSKKVRRTDRVGTGNAGWGEGGGGSDGAERSGAAAAGAALWGPPVGAHELLSDSGVRYLI